MDKRCLRREWSKFGRYRRCFYCDHPISKKGTRGKRLYTVDHIVPRSRKGPNSLYNKVPACDRCNNTKGAMTLQEFREHQEVWEFPGEREFVLQVNYADGVEEGI